MGSQTAIPCSIYRGGTSKGLYFHASDLPADVNSRDAVLLAAMGSPDARQIDGMGGADPLTSKVAIVSGSRRADADIDYLFLQVSVDEAEVDDGQNCGNLLAAVGPFAIESGLLPARSGTTPVRIHMVNTASLALAHIPTPAGVVEYEGNCRIDGAPGTAAAIPIDFLDLAGSSCGALLPTGHVLARIQGVDVTCIDNGMPVCIVRASDFGLSGYEDPDTLEGDRALCARIEALRLEVGRAMNLGDVGRKTTPKMCLVAPPRRGGSISTRNFIPRRVHKAIGVFGAVSVATAVAIPGSVAASVTDVLAGAGEMDVTVEHPSGSLTVRMNIERHGENVIVKRAAFLRTARRLMSGHIFVPKRIWTPE